MFELHQQLRDDCFIIGKFKLCYLLLMNDSNYPWFILVPARENIKEIFELNEEDQIQLLKEISVFSKRLSGKYNAEKINIAALGNVVPQLHVHIIARYKNDPAWAGPVWGKIPAKKYSQPDLDKLTGEINELMKDNLEHHV